MIEEAVDKNLAVIGSIQRQPFVLVSIFFYLYFSVSRDLGVSVGLRLWYVASFLPIYGLASSSHFLDCLIAPLFLLPLVLIPLCLVFGFISCFFIFQSRFYSGDIPRNYMLISCGL